MEVSLIQTASMWDEPSRVICNPVNCVGVMGAGIALEFRYSFPYMHELYKLVCKRKLLWPGDVLVALTDNYIVMNVATKGHYKYRSQMRYILDIITNLNVVHNPLEEQSIGMPKLGAGLGGLDWNAVKFHLEEGLNVNTNVYTSQFVARHQVENYCLLYLVHEEEMYNILETKDYDETYDYINTLPPSKLYGYGR